MKKNLELNIVKLSGVEKLWNTIVIQTYDFKQVCSFLIGSVAQLEECRDDNSEVSGANPLSSIMILRVGIIIP